MKHWIDVGWGIIALFILIGCALGRDLALSIGAVVVMGWGLTTMISNSINALSALIRKDK